MNSFEKFYIPKSLDDPDVLMFFTMSELSLFIGVIALGMLFKIFIFGLIAGILFMVGIKQVKSRFGSDQVMMLLYWYMPVWISNLKYFPESYKRRLIG